jgi:hypothetical protein
LLVKDFKIKYSNLIAEYLEKYPDRFAFRKNNFTRGFLDYLQQKNIKITFKYIEIKPYNSISEFFANFLKEHAYLSKKIAEIYIDAKQPHVDEYGNIRRMFRSLINQHMKSEVLERYSHNNYKINKEMVN